MNAYYIFCKIVMVKITTGLVYFLAGVNLLVLEDSTTVSRRMTLYMIMYIAQNIW